MYRTAALVVSLAALCLANSAFQFSADTEAFLSSPLQTSFTCENRPYGYYADQDNNCEVFHVCVPIADNEGAIIETVQYSFICGNQTVFSQDSLTCSHPEEALPCSEAANLYDAVNGEFGRIPEERK